MNQDEADPTIFHEVRSDVPMEAVNTFFVFASGAHSSPFLAGDPFAVRQGDLLPGFKNVFCWHPKI
ncbi:hypothetical protein PILCRDRAFT_821524 [Piloderma croceum F 1598]|uniref:Uncharacterized protein n=1 Tax=Piloderma croceum (strain F 1598) TaxID=765440 RepID=A0A0C3B596_PILCF|nr:hypothetical protein PILCRDRAFT_821524 [Piloderma croceum F 1598]